MPRRRLRPPFALGFLAIVALFIGGVVLIAGGGNAGPKATDAPPSTGSASACLSTHAAAQATLRSSVQVNASASVPLTVVERATVRGVSTAVRLSERVVERASIARPVLVRRGAVASGRACARGSSAVAARGAALTRAYKKALATARVRARALAAQSLRTYVAQLTPSTQADAHSAALTSARAAARAARPRLAQQALAQARKRAGGG